MNTKAFLSDEPIKFSQEAIKEFFLKYVLNEQALTSREIDVLMLLILGYPAKKMARNLGISFRTVESHVAKLKSKLGCRSKHELLEKLLGQLLCRVC